MTPRKWKKINMYTFSNAKTRYKKSKINLKISKWLSNFALAKKNVFKWYAI